MTVSSPETPRKVSSAILNSGIKLPQDNSQA